MISAVVISAIKTLTLLATHSLPRKRRLRVPLLVVANDISVDVVDLVILDWILLYNFREERYGPEELAELRDRAKLLPF